MNEIKHLQHGVKAARAELARINADPFKTKDSVRSGVAAVKEAEARLAAATKPVVAK